MLVVALAALLGAVAMPGRALAHGGGGRDGSNYRSVVDSPGTTALEWEISGGDVAIRLTNRTGEVVTVEGYDAEPYLRFVPGSGVFENLNSPATYMNEDRYAVIEVPARADSAAAPEWRQVAGGDTHAWHDHRIHWMSNTLPPMVVIDPSIERKVMIWEIPVAVGEDSPTRVDVEGSLYWMPSVEWWPPVLVTLLVFGAIALSRVLRTRPEGREWRQLARPVTVLVWLVLALNAVRTVDDMVASGATVRENLTLVVLVAPMCLAILALTWRSWQGHPGGFGALALAGVLMMVVFGGESGSQLGSPLLVTELPEWVRRWAVASSFTLMGATTIAALAGAEHYRRLLRSSPAAAERLRRRTSPPATRP